MSAVLLSGGDALAQGSVATDKAALEALYDATDGSNWTTSTNWKTSEPLSEWHGVTTDEDGRVTGLTLAGNELSGEIPAALGGLSSLQDLYLYENRLSGEIPPELGQLTNLQWLYLDDNTLSGEIPPELANLTQLQVFDIRNTGLCVTAGSELQTWLATIDFQGAVCATRPPSGTVKLSSLAAFSPPAATAKSLILSF